MIECISLPFLLLPILFFCHQRLIFEVIGSILSALQMHVAVSRITYLFSSIFLKFSIRAKAKFTGSRRIILVISLIILIFPCLKEGYCLECTYTQRQENKTKQLRINNECSKCYSQFVSDGIVHPTLVSILDALNKCSLLIGNELREVHDLLNDHKKPWDTCLVTECTSNQNKVISHTYLGPQRF